MAGIGERLKGLLWRESPAAEGSVKALAEIEAMSREEFQKEIQARLEGLPRKLQAAFACRAALCVLPSLAVHYESEFLGAWQEVDRKKYLLAVLRAVLLSQVDTMVGKINYSTDIALDVTITVANISKLTAFNAIDVAEATIAAFSTFTNTDSGLVPAKAAYSISAATIAATNLGFFITDSNIVPSTVHAATVATYADPKLQFFLLEETEILRILNNAQAFLARPLPDSLTPQAQRFIAELQNFGSGFDWWADWYERCLRGESFDSNELKSWLVLPESLLEQGPAAVNTYLKSLTKREATQPLNRIRLIFLGYGQSGKTSLVRALHNEDVVAGEGDMTPGIEIREWPVPNSAIKAHVWDFGGQVMAHATHQFFLRESCVYVLVMEPRAEINANQQAQYWLEHVRLFGKDAPVLLVGNKADVTALHLDLNTLKDSYPNLVGFFPMSCTGYRDQYRHQFEIFRNALSAELRQAGTHQLLFTPRHFAVLEALRQWPKDQTFLPKPDYEALCDRYEVAAAGELDRGWLLDLLDKLGEVVHFPGIDWLGAYVLNPRWLTYGVYTLLYSEEARAAAGRLTQPQVIAILGRGGCADNTGNRLAFSSMQSRFILDAMQRFELCYALPEAADTFILPDLLPSDRLDELGFDKNQALAFDLDFAALLPRHLMTSFIVRRHAEIVRQRVWQNGVVLGSHHWQAEALVQADHHRRRLSLWVTGKDAARYFTTLHDEFMLMLDRLKMRPPQYQEWVVLPGVVFAPGTEPARADFRDLLALEASGKTEYVCKYGTFRLSEVLKIMPKDERERQGRTNNFYGPTAYAERGTINDVTFGNKTVLIEQAKQLDEGLERLRHLVRTKVVDDDLRQEAKLELVAAQEDLAELQQGDERQQRSALQSLSRFGDGLKEGTSGTVKALKSIKDGGEAVVWLMEQAPAIIAGLAAWLA